MHCSKLSGVDTVSSLDSVPELTRTVDSLAETSNLAVGTLTVDSLPAASDFSFSRQTTLERPSFSRQTTPAVEFCDSPYCSDFDATSEPGDAKAEALDDLEKLIEPECEVPDNAPEATHPPPDDHEVMKHDRFRFEAFQGGKRGFSHFGATAVRRVSSADGRLQC